MSSVPFYDSLNCMIISQLTFYFGLYHYKVHLIICKQIVVVELVQNKSVWWNIPLYAGFLGFFKNLIMVLISGYSDDTYMYILAHLPVEL